jgi:hypothetical protein
VELVASKVNMLIVEALVSKIALLSQRITMRMKVHSCMVWVSYLAVPTTAVSTVVARMSSYTLDRLRNKLLAFQNVIEI